MPPNIYVPTYMPIYNELDSRQRLLLKLKFRVALISPFNKASNVIFPPTITLYNLQQYLLLWINDLIKLLKIITLFFKKINSFLYYMKIFIIYFIALFSIIILFILSYILFKSVMVHHKKRNRYLAIPFCQYFFALCVVSSHFLPNFV